MVKFSNTYSRSPGSSPGTWTIDPPGLTVRMPREWYLYVTAQARKEGMKPGDWVARFLVTELTKKGVKP